MSFIIDRRLLEYTSESHLGSVVIAFIFQSK